MKAEYFRLAKEVAADYALLRGTMHKKGVDIGLTLKVLRSLIRPFYGLIRQALKGLTRLYKAL